MRKAKEIAKQRASLIEQAETIRAAVVDGEMTDEQAEQITAIGRQVADLNSEYETASQLEAAIGTLDATSSGLDVPAVPAAGLTVHSDPVENPKTVPATARRHGPLKSFKGPDAEFQAYQAGRFLAASTFGHEPSMLYCREHGIPLHGAMSGITNTAGGFVVFDQYANSLIDLVTEYGVFRQNADIAPMSSDVQVWPRILTGLTSYFTAENTAVTESALTGDDVSLTARELAVLTKIPNTLSEDAIINLADVVSQKIAHAFAMKEDQCGFIGTGSSTYGGMIGAEVKIADGNHAASIQDAASGNTAFSTLDLADFEATVGILPKFPGIEPKWYISTPGYAASMVRLMDAAGGNTADHIAGGSARQFLGYPIVFSEVLDSTLTADASAIKCLFGDLKMAATMGVRRVMTIGSDAGGKYFENRQIAIQGTERFDINVHSLGDGSNAGPLVALKTAAS